MKLGTYLALVASCSLTEASSLNLKALIAENSIKSSASAAGAQDDDGYDRSSFSHEDAAAEDSTIAKFHDTVKKAKKDIDQTVDESEAKEKDAKAKGSSKKLDKKEAAGKKEESAK